jgi:DNA helicase-2/ATP-dependent DNA helicase PcrA
MLNERQKLAVETKSRNIEVIAGAGTGKTTVIAERVKYLVNELKVKPSEILCISFTVKAVEEMAERVGISGVEFKTLHALALKILKHDRPETRVIDPDLLAKEVEKIKAENPEALELRELQEEALKRLDIDKAVKDLQNEKTRKYWQGKFKFILVDEAQDLEPAQFNLLKILGQKNSVFIVGDPLQSIYSWRGADPEIFKRFEEAFNEVKTIRLIENYRSAQQILDRASRFMGAEKPLKAVSDYKDFKQEDFKIERFEKEREQLDFINEIIERQDLKDYLILGRTHGALEYLQKNGKDPERVMTLHKAKGKEAETVFIVGFTAPILPLMNGTITRTLLMEEKRICYVGLTRAKKQVFLSYIGRQSKLSFKLEG